MTEETIVSPDVLRKNRIPPGQRETRKWPVLHAGNMPRIDLQKWTFKISGLIDKEVSLSLDEFTNLPTVKVRSDIHCVTSWSKLDNLWEGVSTSVIKDLAVVSDEARFVIVHALPDFTTNLPVDDFFTEDVLFALKNEGEDLNLEHGAPVRLVVPRLYFWKSAKWVTGVEFLANDRPGYWESLGYHDRGDPWKEERYRD